MKETVIFVLFGATGDLAQRKIVPALYNLFRINNSIFDLKVVAFSRRPWDDDGYRNFILPVIDSLSGNEGMKKKFLEKVAYVSGNFDDATAYDSLRKAVESATSSTEKVRILYYLAVQPEFYSKIINGLHLVDLLSQSNARILVEKPFGHDLVSAEALEKEFEKKIKPEQLFRIDHYLAKDGLREMLRVKRTDKAFESKLNNKNIKSINVRMFEKIGIEGRGDFYEKIGALRDVGQNHVLQMLATLLMNPEPKDENVERAKVLRSLVVTGEPIFGQYVGYTKETDVDPNSKVETYFKIEAESNDPKLKGVPIILESGKAMSERKAEVEVNFIDGTKRIFDIQKQTSSGDAYEVLIEQAALDNRYYFASTAEIDASWRFLLPVFKKRAIVEPQKYHVGTNGPLLR